MAAQADDASAGGPRRAPVLSRGLAGGPGPAAAPAPRRGGRAAHARRREPLCGGAVGRRHERGGRHSGLSEQGNRLLRCVLSPCFFFFPSFFRSADSFDPASVGLRRAEDVFSLEQFRADALPFLRAERATGGFYADERFRPTRAHRLVAALAARGMLLREFTQNIDSLRCALFLFRSPASLLLSSRSVAAGVPEALLVEAHGHYRRAHCVVCGREADIALVREAVFGGPEPRVPQCPACRGALKPCCTFFGEKMPARFWRERGLVGEAEVLLVVGTSLQVEPFASLADEARPSCVRVLLNREAVGPFAEPLRDGRSFVLAGDIEQTVAALAAELGWQL